MADSSETFHYRMCLVFALAREEELGGLRDIVAKTEKHETRGQIHQPKDAPAGNRLERGRKADCYKITSDCTEAANQDQRPTAMLGRHHLGEKSVSYR